MPTSPAIPKAQTVILYSAVFVYALSRICQIYPDTFSVPLIVFTQVVSPAIFALLHGAVLYGVRGIFAFTAICLSVGAVSESLSLRTGFPFGHYYFTGLMGPKVFDLPILLVLAYLGIGYCSWILSVLIFGAQSKPLTGPKLFAIPLLAGFIMTAWDLSMDPIWATLDRAWIWRDGGLYCGVPISNFLGWYFTAFLFYQAFALYCRDNSIARPPASLTYWRAPILCYAICALGNLLIFKQGLFPPTATDPSGRLWMTSDILHASTFVSLLLMTPMAVLAWQKLKAED
jgi:putative membrane protein